MAGDAMTDPRIDPAPRADSGKTGVQPTTAARPYPPRPVVPVTHRRLAFYIPEHLRQGICLFGSDEDLETWLRD